MIIETNNEKYLVIKRFAVDRMTPEEAIKYKNDFNYESLIKNNTHYHFCMDIPDVNYTDVIEEINSQQS